MGLYVFCCNHLLTGWAVNRLVGLGYFKMWCSYLAQISKENYPSKDKKTLLVHILKIYLLSLFLVVTLLLYVLHEFAGKVDPQVALVAAEHAPKMLLLSDGRECDTFLHMVICPVGRLALIVKTNQEVTLTQCYTTISKFEYYVPVIVKASIDGVKLLTAPGAFSLPIHDTLLIVRHNSIQWKSLLALGAHYIS